tara:strand:- start:2454 stop:15458 length:13005 start_codon:yes stop_codon:yes gene_type:complete
MTEKRVQLSQVIKSQLPSYVKEDFPLIGEFLSQYYSGQEYQGGPLDLIQNIDSYIKLISNGNVVKSTTLTYNLDAFRSGDIYVQNTDGFPDTNGLLKIEDEIIFYESKTDVTFVSCTRGFSGVTSFENGDDPENLVFSATESNIHEVETVVENLNVLFLEEFLKKIKVQLLSGLEEKDLYSELDQVQFIRNSKDFYSSRGTDESFKILFKALYGENAEIIRPIDYVISPSNANFRKSRDLVVEPLFGDPTELLNRTLFQDTFENIEKAYAPVSHVEKIFSGVSTDSTYYKISIDSSLNQNDGSTELLYGNFSLHAKTYIIGNIGVGQSYLDVDSTVGFPKSGTLTFNYKNGTTGICTYSEKTNTQFLGINTTGITNDISDGSFIDQNTYAYTSDDDVVDGIRVKIRSVLNDVKIPPQTYYQKKGSKVKIKSLGKVAKDIKSNNWIFNTAQFYDVKSLTLIDATNNTYRLVTKDPHILRIGDKLNLTDIFATTLANDFVITDIFSETACIFRGTGITNTSDIKKVTRKITKIDSDLHSDLNILTANVQNVYLKPDLGTVNGKTYYGPYHEHPETGVRMVGAKHTSTPHDIIIDDPNSSKVLVSSSSLPSTTNVKLNPNIEQYTFGGVFISDSEDVKITSGVDHNFYTGDAVYYEPEKVTFNRVNTGGQTVQQSYIVSELFAEGIYFVKRVDANTVKLAKSRSNIYNGIFVKVVGGGLDTITISQNNIQKLEYYNEKIKAQKILREIKHPETDGKVHETQSGYTGILVNGVEVLNYKSDDYCYYGSIDSIQVTNGGEDYDVINPPALGITDSVGSAATGFCHVEGSVKEIKVFDKGFDYLDTPIVKISGGNGSGATAEAKLTTVPHEVSFDASGIGSARIGVDTSTIGFTTSHKFRTGERVVYKTFGKKALVGLASDSSYYVNVKDNYTITLHKNIDDASVGLSTIGFTDFGEGIQSLNSYNGKSIVKTVAVINPGSGYQNKKTSCVASGIDTSLNLVSIKNHGYQSGEILKYTVDGTTVGGLTNSSEYYVTKLNNDQFKLSAVGVGTTQSDFFYNTKQYQDFSSIGVGTHTFNYQDITVTIDGRIGISSIEGKTFDAVLKPIIRGSVTSIHLSNNGVGYGSSDILNFERFPLINLNTGRGAVISPVVINGRIVDAIVSAGGTDYNSTPEIKITGIGIGAEIVAETDSTGKIISVNVTKSGAGYGSSTTSFDVIKSGKFATFKTSIQSWRVNSFRKNLANIKSDDVTISSPTNKDLGLQCSYTYAPRELRKILYASNSDGTVLFGKKDLRILNNTETNIDAHSPIIGWAYDGHPIYGPFGFAEVSGGSIVQLKSGYTTNLKTGRPPTGEFPPEFFVEDFLFLDYDDDSYLDENNGRFCVTPEYPNGTYAYFATFESVPSSDGVFKNFKKPVFPYLIGENFNSKPNPFNTQKQSNQDDFDLNKTTWIRNTYPYSISNRNSGYVYTKTSYKDIDQDSVINFVKKGSVDSLGILTGGQNYRVNDKVVFNKEIDSSFVANARVAKVAGPGISTISAVTTNLRNVEFYSASGDSFLGISTVSHGLNNNDIVQITGITTSSSLLDTSIKVGVTTTKLALSKAVDNIGATGIVTYFSVIGGLNIKENDIFKVGNENVRILNVDRISSRLRVLRQENSTTGTSHTSTTVIEDLPRKLFFSAVGVNTAFTNKINSEYYFNPAEAVGLAQSGSTGVGIGTTLGIANPGAGATQIFVPTQAIYFPNHRLETGDVVTYQTNTGSSIGIATNSVVGNGVTNPNTTALSSHSELFVAKLGIDFIGLSTVKVGLSTLGKFVGSASSTSHQGLVFFLGIGTGVYHSLKTVYPRVIKGTVEKNSVTVSAAGSHGLTNNDIVSINVNLRNTVTKNLIYNKANRKTISTGLAFTTGGITTSVATGSAEIPNSISISDHGLVTGQKIIHISDNPAEGLESDKEYFAYVVDKDTIRLTSDKFQTTKSLPNFVGIVSTSNGEIFPVNPPIKLYKNSIVNFDLSDSTLSYTQNATSYAAFDLKFYYDSNFEQEYVSAGSVNDDGKFDVKKTGTIGVTSDAKVTLRTKQNTPSVLYYKLDPVLDLNNPVVNREIAVDNNLENDSTLLIQNSVYSGNHGVIVNSENTFKYDVNSVPEASSYTSATAVMSFDTKSTTAYGPITEVKLTDKGAGYTEVPGITTVRTTLGSGAILEPGSTTIGRVEKLTVKNIGFDYPSDLTLRPTANFPQTLKIDPLTGFESIGVTSFGRGYNTAPSLVVIDGRTKKTIPEVKLKYVLGQDTIDILENTNSLSDTEPTIVPVGNPNGIRAKNFVYNSTTQEVSVTLKDAFSTNDTFPFEIGDKVLVEGTSVGVGSTGLGFNSENYDYARFEITEVFQNLSSVGVVTFSLANYLNVGDGEPGVLDAANSTGILVRERDFPQFTSTLKTNTFQNGEDVTNVDGDIAEVFEWDIDSKYLVIESASDFEVGETVTSLQTGNKGIITEKVSFETSCDLDYFSIVDNGWEYEKGFLNKESQKIHDNEYYQSFSYSIKSKVEFDDWKDVVSTINHAAGFRKYGNLQIESALPTESSTTLKPIADQEITRVIDLIGSESLNCVDNFDLVSENFLTGSSRNYSDEINFASRLLTDFAESVGNRVLAIDDFSDTFNNNPRTTPYAEVFRQRLSDGRSQRFIAYVQDRLFTGERQISIINGLHDIGRGFSVLNQYGEIDTVLDLGTFDYVVDGAESVLRYYPNKFEINNYNVILFSYNTDANTLGLGTESVSVGSTVIGESDGFTGGLVSIASSAVEIAGGATANIATLAGIGTDTIGARSAKVLVTVEGSDGSVEYDEVTLVHDGTNVQLMEYGQLTIHSLDAFSSQGNIGTFGASIASDSTLTLNYTPDAGITTASVNTITVGLTSEGYTGIGTYELSYSSIEAKSTSIGSTTMPVAVGVASYSDAYDAAYCFVQVSDTTNGRYEVSEVIIIDDYNDQSPETVHVVEYGNTQVGSGAFVGLGTINARRAGDGSNYTEVTFTPDAGADIEVKTYMNALRPAENLSVTPGGRLVGGESQITFGENATIENGFSLYEGTLNSIKRQFNLQHNSLDIFRRNINGSSTNIVDLSQNTLTIPNHFFVTGEEVVYAPSTGVATHAIGIARTTFVGVGSTTQLPSSVFVIKESDNKIKLARSAEDALKRIAVPLDLTSVGVGTSHSFTSKNQNQKVLVSIDNVIQSPVAGTSVTTTLADSVIVETDIIKFAGITSFFGADYVRVGAADTGEIMKIMGVGIGSTNAIRVQRAWMGTNLVGHSTGALVTKIRGNYNIINNYLNFIEPPNGKNPIGTATNPPSERDWIGITTSASFNGRVFTRSGVVGGSEETYADNYLYDDISQKFTGQDKNFSLTVSGSNVVGVATNNAILLINSIFQEPASNGDYTLTESGGISSVRFTGSASSVSYDVNNANIPVGGVIVSVGSSSGFGYQPLVSAGGTAIVSASGTITSISIGNTGSGYRSGIQTVNVSIQRESLTTADIVAIGTAAITNGHITGVAVTDNRVFYIPRDISNVGYTSITGITTITTSTAHGLSVGNEVVLSGIAFTCDYAPGVGIQSAVYNNVTGIMTVTTTGAHGLSVTGKSSDVLLTGLGFTCALGVGIHTYPRTTDPVYCGTQVTGVSSATQFTVNAGISTVPTFYVSGGIAQPALIAPRGNNNSSSGQDPAFAGTPVLTVIDSTKFEVNSGISTRPHNYSRCGKVNQLLKVIIDAPLSYDNIPLSYASDSPGTGGAQAKIDVVVGQGSSVIEFSISNMGYGYGVNQILTLPVGGATGIPTTSSSDFEEFKITIQETNGDIFTAWSIGQLQVLDDFSNLFNGNRKTFPITLNGNSFSIQSSPGSLVKVQDTLLIFINDILQVPVESYFFEGGSNLTFEEAPKVGDLLKIIFYRGTGGADVVDREIIETVKVGDDLTIGYDRDLKQTPLNLNQTKFLQEDTRTSSEVTSTSSVDTNPYDGRGLSANTRMNRPIKWCRQTEDRIVGGKEISKNRELYNANIFPTTYLLKSVGIGSTIVNVDNVRPFFNAKNENKVSTDFQKDIVIIEKSEKVSAAATAVVGSGTTVTSIVISEGGKGYTSAPLVSIQNPVGLGTTQRATATATISSGTVTSISVDTGGVGYAQTTHPIVLIGPPTFLTETNTIDSYSGDFGIITGIGTTSLAGVAVTGLVLDLVIPVDSFLRDSAITQPSAITASGITTGDLFTIRNSNVGHGLTSLDASNGVVGVGTTYIDGIFRVSHVTTGVTTDTPGFGSTTVTQVVVSVNSLNGLTGLAASSFYGEYSWGKLILTDRSKNQAYTVNTSNGITGIETGPVINRTKSLKVKSYST